VRLKKLCVSIPNLGYIRTETVYSMTLALFYTTQKAQCGLHLFFPNSCVLADSRNKSAQEAMDIGCSHLMFIDSDVSFPQEGILTLASRDKPVIGANYNMRTREGSTVKIADGKGGFLQVTGEQIPQVPFLAGAIATGFMLIQTDVFRKIPKPWFVFEYEPEGDFTRGEDVYFCKKARENDIEVWCDPTVKVGHIGDYVY